MLRQSYNFPSQNSRYNTPWAQHWNFISVIKNFMRNSSIIFTENYFASPWSLLLRGASSEIFLMTLPAFNLPVLQQRKNQITFVVRTLNLWRDFRWRRKLVNIIVTFILEKVKSRQACRMCKIRFEIFLFEHNEEFFPETAKDADLIKAELPSQLTTLGLFLVDCYQTASVALNLSRW